MKLEFRNNLDFWSGLMFFVIRPTASRGIEGLADDPPGPTLQQTP